MTSIALAQASHPAPALFNGNFYLVAATVIPVLFLAIAVQGSQQAEVFETVVRELKFKPGEKLPPPTIAIIVIWLCVTIAALGCGTIAEVQAIVFLWDQNVPPSGSLESHLVLYSLMVLVAIAGLNAMFQWTKPLYEAMERLDSDDLDSGDGQSTSGKADPKTTRKPSQPFRRPPQRPRRPPRPRVRQTPRRHANRKDIAMARYLASMAKRETRADARALRVS